MGLIRSLNRYAIAGLIITSDVHKDSGTHASHNHYTLPCRILGVFAFHFN